MESLSDEAIQRRIAAAYRQPGEPGPGRPKRPDIESIRNGAHAFADAFWGFTDEEIREWVPASIVEPMTPHERAEWDVRAASLARGDVGEVETFGEWNARVREESRAVLSRMRSDPKSRAALRNWRSKLADLEAREGRPERPNPRPPDYDQLRASVGRAGVRIEAARARAEDRNARFDRALQTGNRVAARVAARAILDATAAGIRAEVDYDRADVLSRPDPEAFSLLIAELTDDTEREAARREAREKVQAGRIHRENCYAEALVVADAFERFATDEDGRLTALLDRAFASVVPRDRKRAVPHSERWTVG